MVDSISDMFLMHFIIFIRALSPVKSISFLVESLYHFEIENIFRLKVIFIDRSEAKS